ncbi:MAG: mannose-1-phosphate guanylyltransferase [Gammaproteobacteria bacterium]|nr:mannose-1-phosphate guanylyltransferase [Gammaproteobacteria bacterium]
MRAMILAAGLGTRMQPLTANLPKPLLEVGGKTLIQHQIHRLRDAGVTELVINHFYLGRMIEEHLGDGSLLGVKIDYSREPILLETAGGIIKSLPKLRDESFIVVNADVWSDFDFALLQPIDGVDRLAHLVLVRNTEHNPLGDFYIDDRGRVHEDPEAEGERLTFSGISVMHKKLFSGLPIQPMSVTPLLQQAMKGNKISGEIHNGAWLDVGTPERLQEVQARFTSSGEVTE